mgnify:CR=1 FL=1
MSKMQMEIRSLPIDISSETQGDNLVVSGIVNGSGSISQVLTNPSNGRKFRETIAPGVFNQAIQNAKRIDFLSQHDKSMILSTTDNDSLELRETDKGLEMTASITNTSWGKDTFQLIKDGIIKGMSFGMRVSDDSWTMGNDGIPMRTINGINLFEVSAVRNPAYLSSEIEARDVDVIKDVDIPDNIEERSEELAEEVKETVEEKVDETKPSTEVKKTEESEKQDVQPEKEGDHDSTEAEHKESAEETETPADEQRDAGESTVKVELSDEVRAYVDAAITSMRGELAEFRSQLEDKTKEKEETREADDVDEKNTEERSLPEFNEKEQELRQFFNGQKQ